MRIFALIISLSPLFASLHAQRLEVVLFLAESCPICKSITAELRALDADYADSLVRFTAYFPTKSSTAESRLRFARKYNLKFSLLADSTFGAAKEYNARVTPEVVLMDIASNRIVYRGMVDDSFASVGKRRTIVKKHYLRDAINAALTNNSLPITETDPVGCIIQFPQ